MQITIGDKKVGDGHPCYVIAELGINHNGSVDIACQLIDAAKQAGCDAVKFQKRTIELCYTKAELDKPRESPWGSTTRAQKEGLELSPKSYRFIDGYCRMASPHPNDGNIYATGLNEYGIDWFASCWDVGAVEVISSFAPPCYKVASCSVTDHELIKRTCRVGNPIILSTGMSTLDEVDRAVELIRSCGSDVILMHCVSTYPSRSDELNLRCIPALRERYGCLVGYSGHEVGLQTTLAAVALGACVVERHLTLDRTMYGSDQSASIEPHGFKQLVRDIREIEKAMGDGVKRVLDSEIPIRQKLRRVTA